MQVTPEFFTDSDAPLQVLLFVDDRPSSKEQIQQVQDFLQGRSGLERLAFQIVEVAEHPYLAEHFRIIATPALIKIRPEPWHTVIGSNLIHELEALWPYWEQVVEDSLEQNGGQDLGETCDPQTLLSSDPQPRPSSLVLGSVAYSAELIHQADEIFQLKRENAALQDQLEFKDRILAMLAHDLRNPLTATSLALETLEMAFDHQDERSALMTPDLVAQLVQHARTQTRTIERMITDILQATRGSQSELQLRPEVFSLGDLGREVLDHFGDRLRAKCQVLSVDIPQDLPPVYADQERIRQVITNLVDNAIKYTPKEGMILVSVLHRTTQKVQMSVSDNGPGIPEANQKHIFEENFRLQRDKKQDGYGIGLALCQELIRAHYGQIWVDSVPGQGSCFHFTLPIYRE